MSAPRPISVREIVHGLSAASRDVCRELFPQGAETYLRYTVGSLAGEPGQSLSIYLRGPKPGNWQDFNAAPPGNRGDILDLVSHTLFGGNKGEAVIWAKRFLGIDSASPADMKMYRRQVKAKRQTAEAAAQAEHKKRRGAAWRIWGVEAGAEIRDTPVDLYLSARGIELDRVPSHGALRYHSELVDSKTGELLPAMVATICDARGKFMGCHRTFLEWSEDRNCYVKASIDAPKRCLGSVMGGHISINKGSSKKPLSKAPQGDTALICEGIEDALTLAMACPETRVLCAVTLGNMAEIEIPKPVTTRILFKDNDAPGSQAAAAFANAVKRHAAQCDDVRIAQVPGAKDANEFLQNFNQQGAA